MGNFFWEITSSDFLFCKTNEIQNVGVNCFWTDRQVIPKIYQLTQRLEFTTICHDYPGWIGTIQPGNQAVI